jgi:excisionase family DNA binding protein
MMVVPLWDFQPLNLFKTKTIMLTNPKKDEAGRGEIELPPPMQVLTMESEAVKAIFSRLEQLISLLKGKYQSADQWLTLSDAIKVLAVSRRTLQEWRDKGKVAFSQVGGKIYFKLTDLHDLLTRNYRKAFAQ